MATQEKLERLRDHWDQRAANYTETANKRVTIQCAHQLYHNMQLQTATSVIEVAAGAGLCAKDALDVLASGEARGSSKKRFLVTDLSPVMVEFAQKNLSGLHSDKVDIQVEDANGQDLVNVASGSMDRYMASMCLQLCPDPDALLREARRVITDDGLAGFTIWGRPEFSGLFAIDSAISKELGTGDGSDHPNFALGKNLVALRERFAAAGFSTVQIWPFLCVLELWSGKAFADFHGANWQDPNGDAEVAKRRDEIATRLGNEWLAKGFPIGLEAYIIIAKP